MERILVAPEHAVLLVLEVLTDREDVLPRAAQIARKHIALRLREQIRELVHLPLKLTIPIRRPAASAPAASAPATSAPAPRRRLG